MSRLTKAEGDRLAADFTEQQRLRDTISVAENTMRVFGFEDYDPSNPNVARSYVWQLKLPESEQRDLSRLLHGAYEAWDKLNDLEIAATKRRKDFLGNEYTVGDIVTWPIGSGSNSASIRIGRVVEFRNNGGVAIMPLEGRWGGDPKLVTVKGTNAYITCVTEIINNVQEDTP